MTLSVGLFNVTALHIEPSSMCQAHCTMCPRSSNTNKSEHAGYLSWDSYNKQIAPYINGMLIYFCGNYGDPMMNPDMSKIAIDVVKRNNNSVISTNGGIGKTNDYYEMCKQRVKIVFDVEGTTQELHERYRRGVNYSKLKENIFAAYRGFLDREGPDTFESNIEFYVIPWAHTVKDLKNIVELARSVKAFIKIGYPRHLPEGTQSYDKDGNIVGYVTVTENLNNARFGTFIPEQFDELLSFDWGKELPIVKTNNNILRKTKTNFDTEEYIPRTNVEFYNFYENSVKVNCQARQQQSVFISADLKVLPCCHLGTFVNGETLGFLRPTKGDERRSIVMDKYFEIGNEKFDLTNKTLYDIVYDDDWRNFAFSNVEGQKIYKYCEEICGLCKTN